MSLATDTTVIVRKDAFADGGDPRDGPRAMRAVFAACVIGVIVFAALAKGCL